MLPVSVGERDESKVREVSEPRGDSTRRDPVDPREASMPSTSFNPFILLDSAGPLGVLVTDLLPSGFADSAEGALSEKAARSEASFRDNTVPAESWSFLPFIL